MDGPKPNLNFILDTLITIHDNTPTTKDAHERSKGSVPIELSSAIA